MREPRPMDKPRGPLTHGGEDAMSAYRICEDCGAALDPEERCDCRQEGRVELILPGGRDLSGKAARLKRLMNSNFDGVATLAALTMEGGA